MLELIEKPKEFYHLSDRCLWFVVKSDKDIAYLGVEMVKDQAAIHLHVLNWSHNALKTMLEDWRKLVNSLRSRGIKYLIASNQDTEDKRWHKFINLFGFPEPTLVKMSKLEIK